MKVKLLLLMLLFPVLLLMPLLCVAEDKELEQYVAEQHQILFDYVQNNSKFDPDFYMGLEQSIQGLIISTEISKRVMETMDWYSGRNHNIMFGINLSFTPK